MPALIIRARRKRWFTCQPLQTLLLFAALPFYPLSKHLTLIHVLGVCMHLLSCLCRFTAVLVLWSYSRESWWVCREAQIMSKTLIQELTGVSRHDGMLLCLQQPVAGQRQQKQHAMKANQRFIWLGNLHLITAVMSWVKRMIFEVSPAIFPAYRGASLLLCSPCEWCHLLIII